MEYVATAFSLILQFTGIQGYETPPLADGELQNMYYTRHSGPLSSEGSFSCQHLLRTGTPIYTVSPEGPVSTFHSRIRTRHVRINSLLCDSNHCATWATWKVNCDARESTICRRENLALNKPAVQSSTFTSVVNFSAVLAVDGNTDQRAARNSCARTNFDPIVWWRVDLQATRNIYSIKVFYRNDSDQHVANRVESHAGFALYVSNTTGIKDGFLCYKNEDKLPPLLSEHVCVTHGRYVTYYNERGGGAVVPQGSRPTSTIADLCEVQVFGCSKDFVYGKNCDRPCPDNCLGRECHIVTGYCQECIDGRQGQQCDKCNDGFFGPNCTTHCSEFCNNVTCDSSTGECLFGCAAGFTGLQCNTRCIGGNYGENCSSDCGHCVRGKMCDHVSGLCEGGCAEGYKGQICKTPCSHGEYGKNCSQRCSSNCLNGEICNPFYGRCISCTPGWKGLLCKEACKPGMYGANCSSLCGKCRDNQRCHHVTGRCPGNCSPGWKPPGKCDEECDTGTYGENCWYGCSANCYLGNICDKGNGSCIKGCKTGWTSRFCNKTCKDGLYGPNCKLQCSSHCFNNAICDRETGLCPLGCHEGYVSPLCHQTSQNTSMQDLIGPIIGIAIGSSLAAYFIIVLLKHIRRKLNSKNPIQKERTNQKWNTPLPMTPSVTRQSQRYQYEQPINVQEDSRQYELLDDAV